MSNTPLTLEHLLSNLTKQASESEGSDTNGENTSEKKSERPSDEELAKLVAIEKKEHGENLNKENPEMSKQAHSLGVMLAQSILTKQANTVIGEQAAISAAQEVGFKPNPQGTTDQVVAQVAQNLQANGAQNPDITAATQPAAVAAPVTQQDPLQQQDPADPALSPEELAMQEAMQDEQEKAAAVAGLVEHGMDFDSAIALVKEAEFELLAEQDHQIKMAAMQHLIENGADFADAAEMIKQASEVEVDEELVKLAFVAEAMDQGFSFDDSLELLKQANAVVYEQQAIADAQANGFHPNAVGTKEEVAAQIAQRLQAAGAQNPESTEVTQPAAPETPLPQAVATAAYSEQEKKAFLCSLIDNGLDMQSAAGLVGKLMG